MPTDWFRLKEIGDGETVDTSYRPNYRGLDVKRYQVQLNENQPFWICRVTGTEEQLNELESDLSGMEKRLSNVPKSVLNNEFGLSRDADSWDDHFGNEG